MYKDYLQKCNNITRHRKQQQKSTDIIDMMFELHCIINIFLYSSEYLIEILSLTHYLYHLFRRHINEFLFIFPR